VHTHPTAHIDMNSWYSDYMIKFDSLRKENNVDHFYLNEKMKCTYKLVNSITFKISLLYTSLFSRYKFSCFSKGQFCGYLFLWVLLFVAMNHVHMVLFIPQLGL